MNAAQLKEVEAAVGFRLPEEYRQVSLNFPFRPIGRDRVYWFYDDPKRVIHDTLKPLADGGYNRVNWKNGYLAIGESAAGDLYVLDTTATALPVLCLSHETHAFEPEWPTFEAYMAEWLKTNEGEQTASPEAKAQQRKMKLIVLILIIAIDLPLLVLLFIWLAR